MSSLWAFTSWTIPITLQKRILKFVLKKTIGQFLATELDLVHLDVQLGRVHVGLRNLDLNVEPLNDLLGSIATVRGGRINEINVTIPWSDLRSGSIQVEISDVLILLEPTSAASSTPDQANLHESLLSPQPSLSSSIHFANEFFHSEDEPPVFPQQFTSSDNKPSEIEGLQILAGIIDNIISRIVVSVHNVTLRCITRRDENWNAIDIVLPSITVFDQVMVTDVSDDENETGLEVLAQQTFPEEITKIFKFPELIVKAFDVVLPKNVAINGVNAVNMDSMSLMDFVNERTIFKTRRAQDNQFRVKTTQHLNTSKHDDPLSATTSTPGSLYHSALESFEAAILGNAEASHEFSGSIENVIGLMDAKDLRIVLDMFCGGMDPIPTTSGNSRSRSYSDQEYLVHSFARAFSSFGERTRTSTESSCQSAQSSLYPTASVKFDFEIGQFAVRLFEDLSSTSIRRDESSLNSIFASDTPNRDHTWHIKLDIKDVDVAYSSTPSHRDTIINQTLKLSVAQCHMYEYRDSYYSSIIQFVTRPDVAIAYEQLKKRATEPNLSPPIRYECPSLSSASPCFSVINVFVTKSMRPDQTTIIAKGASVLKQSGAASASSSSSHICLNPHGQYIIRTDMNIEFADIECSLNLDSVHRFLSIATCVFGNNLCANEPHGTNESRPLTRDIFDDLDSSTTQVSRQKSLTSIHASTSFCRVYLGVSDSDGVVLDCFKPHLSHSFGDLSSMAENTNLDGWLFECDKIGISLYDNEGGTNLLKPIFLVNSIPTLSPLVDRNQFLATASSPSFEWTSRLRDLRSDIGDAGSRNPLDIHMFSKPLDMNVTEDTSGNGWFDISGNNGKSGKNANASGNHALSGDDLIWFRQRSIRQTKGFANIQLPVCFCVVGQKDLERVHQMKQAILQSFGLVNGNLNGMQSPHPVAIHTSLSHMQLLYEIDPTRFMKSEMTELRVFAINNYDNKPIVFASLDVEDVLVSESTDGIKTEADSGYLLHRTGPQVRTPMFLGTFLSVHDAEIGVLESTFNAHLYGTTLCQPAVNSRFNDVASAWFQHPTNPVDSITTITKIYLGASNSTIILQPIETTLQSVILVSDVKASSHVMPCTPITKFKLDVKNTIVFLKETSGQALHFGSVQNPIDYWKERGFADVVTLDHCELIAQHNADLAPSKVEVTAVCPYAIVRTCRDSYQALLRWTSSLNLFHKQPEKKPAVLDVAPVSKDKGKEKMTSILDDVDENAFAPLTQRATRSDSTNSNSYPFPFDEETLGESSFADRYPRWGSSSSPSNSSSTPIAISDDVLDDFVLVEDVLSTSHKRRKQERERRKLESEAVFLFHVNIYDIVWFLYDGFDFERRFESSLSTSIRKSGIPSTSNTPPVLTHLPSTTTSSSSPSLHLTRSKPRTIPMTNTRERFSHPYLLESNSFEKKDPSLTETSSWSSRSDQSSDNIFGSPRLSSSTVNIKSSKNVSVEIRVKNVKLDYATFPDGHSFACFKSLSIWDLEVLDRVRTSVWKTFLSIRKPDGEESRARSGFLFKSELASVRVNNDQSEEQRLKMDIQPLRLFIDQDTLNFLLTFFASQPVDSRADKSSSSSLSSSFSAVDSTFFQICQISRISLTIDYKPKHVDLKNFQKGNILEFLNLFQMNDTEIDLKAISLGGVQGWQRLSDKVNAQWFQYVQETQLPKIIGGVSPIRSLVNVGSGVIDLVLLPMEQYHKDRNLIKGLQRGGKSFIQATTLETLKLGTRLSVGTQVFLEQLDEVFNSNEEEDPASNHSVAPKSKFSGSPRNIQEGLVSAYQSLSRNMTVAAKTVVAVPMEVYEQTNSQGAMRSVVRAVPVAVLKPLLGVSEAVSKTLVGLQHTLDSNQRSLSEDKYK